MDAPSEPHEFITGKKGGSLKKATTIRLALSALLVALFLTGGLLVTFALADFQREQYFEVRKFQAAAAAASLDVADVQQLTGSAADIGTPAFESLRRNLARVKASDHRIRFVYLMRPQGKQMVFLADAEDPSSKDYSPPGQVYYEARPEEFLPFEGKKKPAPWIMGPVTDRWGTWISANAYITDKSGKAAALLGTDVAVDKALASFNRIKQVGILFTAVATFMLALVLSQWIWWRYNKDKREAMRRAMEGSVVELNRELLEADRMKSEFIDAASHELRGPVTAVNAAVQVLVRLAGPELSEDNRKLLEVAQAGTDRLVDLIKTCWTSSAWKREASISVVSALN